MSSSLRPALRAVLFAAPLFLGACASTSSPAPAAAEPGAQPKAETDPAKKHAVTVAELELKKTLQENQSKLTKKRDALDIAERELEAKREKREAFATERKLELEEGALGLDRSRGRARDSELELAELEAMYAAEEFAEKTKELVLQRGRRNLEHAQRGLAIEEGKLALLTKTELPAKERALVLALAKAEQSVAAARRELELAELETRIAELKAKESLRKAQEPDEKKEKK